ncbi:MAG: hypothetical protein IPP10_17010 [Candidatus Competibacteraceae bacterium]|nr:hypothetical protein [Candidatus Competibacteraceae bacterium]MBK7985054.1 hypothetical protein [Candidatus Competibacteraceae bacterium]MBK8895867.1 hypothetical protein [Candidatus Competibacteraceae bacterium]MBK8962959.1 hypothetical protein [Candidatus Competibacteraceae bacterium]MBK9953105.1 hypothetical protein [Candidatus Competibacteraceae bacterium]
MPDFLRKLIGLLLLLATVGAVSCQALTADPASTAPARPAQSSVNH